MLNTGPGEQRQLPDSAQPLGIAVSRLGRAEARVHAGLHSHDYYAIGFVEAGSGVQAIAGEETRIGPGAVFTMAPGDVHDASGLAEVDGWLCIFARQAVPLALSGPPANAAAGPAPGPQAMPLVTYARLEGGTYDVRPAQHRHWSCRFRALARELHERPPGYPDAARASLALLVIDVVRLALPSGGWAATATDPVVAEAMAVIDRRFADKLSLADVARELARSPNHLARIVKGATGETVVHWIHERRMVAARMLLMETSMTVDEVAHAVGYRDRSYFNRRFRSAHGSSPQGWRRRMRLARRAGN